MLVDHLGVVGDLRPQLLNAESLGGKLDLLLGAHLLLEHALKHVHEPTLVGFVIDEEGAGVLA